MEPSMENTTFRNNFISEKDLPLHFCSGGFLCKDETYYLKRRNLNQYLLLYTIGGEGFLSYEGREYRLLPGMTFLIDCRKDHIYHTANKHWEFSFVHFRAEALREYVDSLHQGYGAVFTMQDPAAMENRMRDVNLLFRNFHPSAHHLAFGLLAEILSMLYVSAEAAHKSQKISEYTARVLQVLEEDYAQKLTLDDIARKSRCSKYYLAHQFKRDLGISIHECLTLLRISQSKLLLQNTNLSVSDIAEQVGFFSVSNYIQTFSKYEITTPHQYRKQWQ